MYKIKSATISGALMESDTPFEPNNINSHWEATTSGGGVDRVFDPERSFTQEWDGAGDGGIFTADWSGLTPPDNRKFKTKVSVTEFKMLFNLTERLAIRTAREYSGSESADLQKKYVLQDFFEILEGASFVDMTIPTTTEGLDYLEAQGFITAERKAEIGLGLEI